MPDDEDVAALYQVVPEQFVAARGALVKRLRSEGRSADAAQVAKLRRPPVTAWALNQVARTAPKLLANLHQAGDGLRRATEAALAGDASGLRPARGAERAAVDAVVADAGQRAQEAGYSVTDAIRQRLAATLRAAIVDDSVAGRLQRGVLETDHEAPGFGMDGLTASPVEAIDAPVVDDAAPRREQVKRDAERLRQETAALTAEAERLEAYADRLAAEASQARRKADQARQRVADRQAEVDALTKQLESQ
jgi:hypothetical protein